MKAAALRLGCTEGQLLTVLIGAAVAFGLLAVGLPPVLRHEITAASPPVTAAPAPTTTTTLVIVAAPAGAPPPTTTTTTTVPRTTPTSRVVVAAPAGPPPPPAPSTTTTTTEPQPTPRSVVAFGWTSSTAGAPGDGAEVPDDGMPVAARTGGVDRASYVRMGGDHPVLALALVEDGSAQRLVALASVEACVVAEDDWELGRAASPADAPPHDADRCVEGRQVDGRWEFDVGSLGADVDAIALLPVAEGPVTFQVTFSAAALRPA